MKNLLLIFYLFFFSVLLGHAQQLTKTDEAFIDSILNANYKANEPGAVILVAKNGKPFFRKAYGMASLELNVPNKPEFNFRIGSISKQFTAVSILQLAQSGKLSLQDDIKKHLPYYNSHRRKITIEHLLTHTSGIPSYTEKTDFVKRMLIDHSKEEMVNYFMNDSLLFEPGANWSYTNSGYMLAGLIVEKISGMSLEEYLQKNIFDPLSMSSTFCGTYEKLIPNAVTGYESAGNKKFRPATYLSWSWPYAAGEIISNVDDMLKWDEALYSNKIVNPELLQKAWANFTLTNGERANYGFGWSTSEYKGLQIIAHGGGINGFLSDAIRIPNQHVYVIILSNRAAIAGPDKVSKNIALRVAGKPLTSPRIISLNKRQMEPYVGVYETHSIGGRLSTNMTSDKLYRYFTVNKDTLFSQVTGGKKEPFLNVGKDLFVSKDSRAYVKFNRDKKQNVISLEQYFEPIQYGPIIPEVKTNLPLPVEKSAITLSPDKLQLLVGKYDFGGGFVIKIIKEGNHLYRQLSGEKIEELYPESETKFFLKTVDGSVEFVKDQSDKVNGLIVNQAGKYQGKKVE